VSDLLRIARDVAACAAAWTPDARLIGNVRADELLALALEYAALCATLEESPGRDSNTRPEPGLKL
jgi:hypothetical protein